MHAPAACPKAPTWFASSYLPVGLVRATLAAAVKTLRAVVAVLSNLKPNE